MNLLNRGNDFFFLVELGDHGDQLKGEDIGRKMNLLMLLYPWISSCFPE